MSLDTLLEAAKYLENIEQNGDTVRSGSSCSGSLSSSGGDRSPGGYLRLDPNLPISSQFHDYFCNPSLVSTPQSAITGARGSSSSSSHNHLNKAANSSTSSPGRTVTGRRQSKSVFGLSPGPRNISISESSDGGGLSELDSTNGQGPGVIVYSGSSGAPPPRPSSTTSSTGTNGRSRNSKLDPETSSRHREMHKTLEKNRRAQLRTCFEELRRELPKSDYSYKKSSHINIIHSAIRYIHTLKRSEWEAEQTLKDLLNAKSNNEQKLGRLETELSLSPLTNGGARSKLSIDDFDSNSDDSRCGTNNKKNNNNGNCLTADTAGPGAVSELIGALLKRAESKAGGKSHHSQAQLQSQCSTTDVKPSNDDLLYISASQPPSLPLSTSSSHPSHEKHAKATFNNTHYE